MSYYQKKKQPQNSGNYNTQYAPKSNQNFGYDDYDDYGGEGGYEKDYDSANQESSNYNDDNGKYQQGSGKGKKQGGYYQKEKINYSEGSEVYYQKKENNYEDNNTYSQKSKKEPSESTGGYYQKKDDKYSYDKGGDFSKKDNYNEDKGGYYQKNDNYNQDKDQGYNQKKKDNYNEDKGGYYQKKENYSQDKDQGYYQKKDNYNEDKRGYNQQKKENYNQDKGGYYQKKDNYNQDKDQGYYQKKDHYNEDKGGYNQQKKNDGYNDTGKDFSKSYNEGKEGYHDQKKGYNQNKDRYNKKKDNTSGYQDHKEDRTNYKAEPKEYNKYAQKVLEEYQQDIQSESHTKEPKSKLKLPSKTQPKFSHGAKNQPSFSFGGAGGYQSSNFDKEDNKPGAMFGYDLDENFGSSTNTDQVSKYSYETEETNYTEDASSSYYEEDPAPSGTATVLMVAEKPSIAKSVAEALSNGKYRARVGMGRSQVLEFNGQMFGRSARFRVTSVTGHVFNADFPKEYQNWNSIDPAELFYTPTIKRLANPKGRTVPHLQKEARNCNYLVLWLDNDKEGENICFEVLDVVKGSMRKENYQQVYRAKFSSLVKQDLVAAFKALKDGPNYNESISVDARQIIDLKIGVAFSRFQTSYFTKKYQSLNTNLISYGPCQTPTLGFCVGREDEIDNFKPRTFYRVCPSINVAGTGKFDLSWSQERTFHESDALGIRSEVEKEKEMVVLSFSNTEATKSRPEALNTVHMLKIASANLGMGPTHALHIAERLYLSGFITYPRTESTSYPGLFDFQSVLKALSEVKELDSHAKTILSNGINKPKKGVDVGDHPPITPTLKALSRSQLGNDEWRLYDFISRHFMATISTDAKYIKRHVRFSAGKHEFQLEGVKVTSKGFTDILIGGRIPDNRVPEFHKGETYPITKVDVVKGETSPPDRLSESDLLGLMEKHGIGTDASMATHINNICLREFVKVDPKGRRLVPTELGISLVHGYQAIDPNLVAPTLRSNIEQSVDNIAKGRADYAQVLDEIISTFSQKFDNFRKNIQKMDSFFEGTFSKIVNVSRVCDVLVFKAQSKGNTVAPQELDTITDSNPKPKKHDQKFGKKKLPDTISFADFPSLE